ncbi:MAG TPA: prolipoprotein diacylglyceryl transferase [Chthonomonadaceae bacterium]|nr:prolipoprotein diacylglyceryl transferase [Chthonomonadaceae bacterium]
MYRTLFHIGSIPIHAYGTLIVLGFLLGLWRAMRLCARRMVTEPEGSPRRISPDTVFDVGIFGLLAGLIGARLMFVLLDWGSYAGHPWEAFKLWEGGLSLHGGLLFGILFLLGYCYWKRVSFLAFADLCAPSWAIAYAIGRIGCLLNGCCYGAACHLPWAMRFPDERYESLPGHPLVLTPPSHPTQLYGTLFNLVFFFLLTRWEKRPRRDGELFFGYIAMYGVYRFIVEMFRAGATSTYLIPSLHLTDTHIVSALMVLAGVIGVAWLRRYHPAVQDADALPGATLAAVPQAKEAR